MDKVAEFFLGQFAALIAFFAFPALSYVVWKYTARNEGRPEVWYIPKYKTFRLVIRNLPRRVTLFDIKSRAIMRETILPSKGTTVATYIDASLVNQSDFFLFPGNDQVLISFQLQARDDGGLDFVVADKIGREVNRRNMAEDSLLICDYIANVKNLFNFDIKIKKRAEISGKTLASMNGAAKESQTEMRFEADRIRDAS